MTLSTIADAITPGSASQASGTGSATLTETITLPDGTTVLWVVACSSGASSTSVTWQGVALTPVAEATSGTGTTDRTMRLWRLNNPPKGTGNIVSVLSGDVRHTILYGAKTGAHMTAPFGTPVTTQGTAGNAASLATGSAFPFMSWCGSRTTSADGNAAGVNQTRRLNVLSGTNQWWSYSEQGAGTTASWTWAGTADRYCALGAQLVPATIPAGINVRIKRGGAYPPGPPSSPLRVWRDGGWTTPLQVVKYVNAPPVESTPYLPFNAPVPDEANTYVFGHYFTQFPFQPNNNTSDYWATKWLPPGTVEAATASFTGTLGATATVGATTVTVDATLAGNAAAGDNLSISTNIKGVYDVVSKAGNVLTITPALRGANAASGTGVQLYRGGTDHRLYGGFTRDRSIAGRGSSLATGWQKIDMLQEIYDAVAAGLDGFWIDMLSITTSNSHWKNLNYLFDAADQYLAETGRHFWLAPMPDGTASSTGSVTTGTTVNSNASADALADALYTFYGRANYWKVAGRYQFPVFGPEKLRAGYSHDDTRFNFWTRIKTRLAAKSPAMNIDYIMCYVDQWTTNPDGSNPTVGTNTAPTFNSLARVHGRWGDRDPVTSSSNGFVNRGAPALCQSRYGRPWQHWAAPGDTRPPTAANTVPVGTYRSWEGKGFLNLHETWMAAIDGASNTAYVQNTTWNDYGENAHVCPSRNNSFAMADLNAYYATWFKNVKNGSATPQPAIVRDCIYMAHRLHPHSQQESSFANTKQVKWASLQGNTAWVNIVDLTCFLVSAATIEFLVNGVVVSTYSGIAGRNRFEAALPASGICSARAKRSGTVVPGTTVTSNINIGATALTGDDYHYRSFSSLRQA